MATTSTKYPALRRKRLKKRLPELIIGLVALAIYVVYLSQQDARVRDRFAQTREESPQTYLEEVRIVRGFDAYLRAYTQLRGSDRFTEAAPDFLLGRWAMFDAPLRVDDRFSASSCRNTLLIENGRVTPPGAAAPLPAKYWLKGNDLMVMLADGERFSVKVIGSGVHLHHLEVASGLAGGHRYAYRCE